MLFVLITNQNAFILFYFCPMFFNVIGVLKSGVVANDKSNKLIILGPLGCPVKDCSLHHLGSWNMPLHFVDCVVSALYVAHMDNDH